MAKYHFVEDYEIHIRNLLDKYPLDQAMSIAVGGDYEHMGQVAANLLVHFGLEPTDIVVDLGCGSGRVANSLGQMFSGLRYTGIDVVQTLLDYAKTKCPQTYDFLLNRELCLPFPAESVDMIFAFSVFTHLLHAETYIYLEDAIRVLRPSGRIVFSFLEFAASEHWTTFESTVSSQRASTSPHLNTFIEQSTINIWSQHLGFHVAHLSTGATPIGPGLPSVGQSLAVLQKMDTA